MSNRRKDGDFNLDEELKSKIAANEEGHLFSDDHEDEKQYEEEIEQINPKDNIYRTHPKLKRRVELLNSDVLLSVRNLKQFFFFGSGFNKSKLKAVSNVSFDVMSGECFGIVGESGCGKTTTGRSIIKLYDITSGSIYYKGYRISAGDRWNKKEIKFTNIRYRKKVAELKAALREAKAEFTKNNTGEFKDSEVYKNIINQLNEAKSKRNTIIATQKKKIRQIHFDNKHCPHRLVNEIQMIFQDPVDSLDPRMTVEDIIQEGLKIQKPLIMREVKQLNNVINKIESELKAFKAELKRNYLKKYKETEIDDKQKEAITKEFEKEYNDFSKPKQDQINELRAKINEIKPTKENRHAKVVEMLEKVGLVADHASRYPHEFSGGQRQRVGIARALVMNPKLLICDEPISALDVSIRAQIINLLNELKEEYGLTLIFVAHDLSVVKYFCDRIAVMYFGKVVELATSDELFKNPLHPYTKSLLSAIPKPNPLSEKSRTRIVYNPNEVHDYSVDKPEFKMIKEGHYIYCNNKEFEEYKKELKD